MRSNVTDRIIRPSSLALLVAGLFLFAGLAAADDPLPRGQYNLTGVEVFAIDRVEEDGKIHFRRSDTLNHWVRFDVRAKFTMPEDSKKKPFKILNRTIASKCKLTLDKPIMFQSEKVAAGENLLKFNKPGKRRRISMPGLNPLATGSIYIPEEFHFPTDVYTLTFEWETQSGTKISQQVTVVIDVGSSDDTSGKIAAPSKEATKKEAPEKAPKKEVPQKETSKTELPEKGSTKKESPEH